MLFSSLEDIKMAMIVFDYFAVLIASVVCFLFGWLWHSSVMFGDMCKKDNKTKKDKGSMLAPFLGYFITLLLTAWVLSNLMFNVGISTFEGALLMAAVIWFGFFATTKLGMVLWGEKSTKFYFISVIYDLLNLCIMALILFFL